uniref:Uncharacterized protein n=1 Tax=Glossina austeni TaxID=7395 RepID=A0A1A9UHS5_GLOAU
MDGVEMDTELPGPSKVLCNKKLEQDLPVLFQLTLKGKSCLEFEMLEANEDGLDKNANCCRSKARKTGKQTEKKRKSKNGKVDGNGDGNGNGKQKQSPEARFKTKDALRH